MPEPLAGGAQHLTVFLLPDRREKLPCSVGEDGRDADATFGTEEEEVRGTLRVCSLRPCALCCLQPHVCPLPPPGTAGAPREVFVMKLLCGLRGKGFAASQPCWESLSPTQHEGTPPSRALAFLLLARLGLEGTLRAIC